MQATLCGSEPVDLFDSFHVQLRAITNQLMADFQLPPDVQARLAIQPPEEFEIASNVKRTVDRYAFLCFEATEDVHLSFPC